MATDKRLRAEELAAIANALVVLVAPALLMMLAQWNEPERAIAVASPPSTSTLAALSRRIGPLVAVAIPLTPFAAIAAWRTYALVKALRPSVLWLRGIAEATVLGALVLMVALLPLTVSRGLPPPGGR